MGTVSYGDLFVGQIELTLKTAISVLAAYPASAAAFMRLSRALKAAEDRRAGLAKDGIEVPPLLIVSTTEACNLACTGCYACARDRKTGNELSNERVGELLDEASQLGFSIVMLAGGEPLLSHSWLDAMGRHDEMLGIVFTNGTLFDARQSDWFASRRHMIPAFSVEGGEAQTDARRGKGVYAKVHDAMRGLYERRVPFGLSITVTSGNIEGLLCDAFIEASIEEGCRLFVFVEYVPVEAGSEPMALSKANKKSSTISRCNAQSDIPPCSSHSPAMRIRTADASPRAADSCT